MVASKDFKKQLAGYGLTTAKILYWMPDYRSILQTYIWQDYDMYPSFPELNKFLQFWQQSLEGPLHRVDVSHSKLIRATDLQVVNGVLRLH